MQNYRVRLDAEIESNIETSPVTIGYPAIAIKHDCKF